MIYKYKGGQFLDVFHSGAGTAQSSRDFHIHDCYEIYYHIKGTLDFFINTHVYSVSPGDLIILRDSEIHNAFFKDKDNCAYARIHFLPEIMQHLSFSDSSSLKMFIDRNEFNNNLLRPSHHESIVLKAFFKEIESPNGCSPENAEPLVLSYFIRILCLIDDILKTHDRYVISNQYNPILHEIITYIDSNLHGDLRLQSICKVFYISPQHLIRLFRNTAGGSLHNYIINKRLIKAKDLLKESCSVEESCVLSGFNDYSNFIRLFKSKIGVSPGKYISQLNY